ncbi:ATP-binding protein [Falsiroseomonas sp.]|uniref:ATP-binding protein n=1 Tax=Falsiroseomonas sp. TaxID=2870721 RepID=UPI003F71B297
MNKAVSQVSISVAPEAEEVPRVLDAIEGFASGISLTARVANRLSVVVEELLANVAMHAQGATQVGIKVALMGDALEVTVEDDGPAFNPTLGEIRTVDEDLDNAVIGGLGLSLVRQMSSSLTYERSDGTNRLTAVLTLQ